MPRVDPPVCPQDLANLRESGLTDSTIRAARLRTEKAAMVFPYRDLDGSVNCFCRFRPHTPKIIGGKAAKYLQPKGSPLRAYYPPASLPDLRDGVSPVYITEGEKKALALSQLGLAAVGLGGMWSGCKKGSEDLIDDLAAIEWAGRKVYIVFDYDAKESTRIDANAARLRLAKALLRVGAAAVYNVALPAGGNGTKQGVDDYLVAKGPTAFKLLVNKAIRVIKITPSVVPAGEVPVIKIIPPPLGEAAYHGPLGHFLRDLASHTEATDAAVLAHLLPALGVYIGPGPHCCDGSGNKQPPRVNTVLVGPTSTGRKGTALAPVDRAMELFDPEFWKAQRVGGLATGEGLVAKVADREEWDEATKTKNTIIVDKRLYVVEEEFSKVLAQIRRDNNILSQIFRESFDSGNLAVMTRGAPLQAFGAHISVTGHITPEELLDRFNHIEMANGFGNRFLWFAIKSDKVLPRCQPIPDAVFTEFLKRIRHVKSINAAPVPLADASMGLWEKEIYPSLREDKPGMSGHLIARGSAIVLRLALIYFLLDPPSKGVSKGIAPVHMDAALAVWDYCTKSVEMLFKTKAGTFLGDKILDLLSAGPMTTDAMNDHLSIKQKADAPRERANLEAAGLIRRTVRKPEGAGRPATVWERAG
jgi:hypothetical protein